MHDRVHSSSRARHRVAGCMSGDLLDVPEENEGCLRAVNFIQYELVNACECSTSSCAITWHGVA